MTQPTADLGAALNKRQAEKPRSRGIASTFRDSEKKVPTKKATYEIPQDLHRALNLHAVNEGASMRDLVVKYIEDGLQNDGVIE